MKKKPNDRQGAESVLPTENESKPPFNTQTEYEHFAFESTADGIMITDMQGHIVWCNVAFYQMTGFQPDEVENQTPRILKSGAQDGKFYKEMWATILEGKVWRGELVNNRKDGQLFVAKETITPVSDIHGNITHFVTIVQDITEKKKAEEQLRRSEALLNSVLEALPVGVWILDKDGKILRGNKAGKDIWAGVRYVGIDKYGEYKGWWVDSGKLIQPDEWAAARLIKQGEISLEEEVEIESFDGTHKYIYNSALPIKDESNQVLGALILNQDVTARLQAERALVHVNQLLEKMISAVDILIVYMDSDFNYIQVNRAYAEFDGHDPDYYAGKNYFSVFPNEENKSIFRTVVESGEPVQIYGKPVRNVRFPETGISYWDWSLQPVKDIRGLVQGIVLTLHDSTRRVKAENSLRESEERYRTLVENSPNGIFVFDSQRRIQFANQRMEGMLGLENLETLNGLPLEDLFSPEQCESIEELVVDVLATGTGSNIEISLLRNDGARIPVEFHLSIIRSAEPEGQAFIGELRDITVQMNNIELIRQNAERATVLSEVSSILVESSLDEQAVLDAITRASAEHIGDAATIRVASDDRLWLEPASFHHRRPASKEMMRTSLESHQQSSRDSVQGKVFQSGQALFQPKVDLQMIRDRAPEIYHGYIDEIGISGMMIVPLRIQEGIIGTYALYRDAGGSPFTLDDLTLMKMLANRVEMALTNARLYRELKAALYEEQEMHEQLIQSERFAVAGRMLASITHEINNPVQTIKNCLYLSQQELLQDSPVSKYLHIAATETERIANLVAQLREIYRPQGRGKESLVNVHQLLAESETLLAPHLASAHVLWELKVDPDVNDYRVFGMPEQLKQVFLNLSLNAIEAMQPEGGYLSIDLTIPEETKQVKIVFRDTGRGIEADDLDRLFEPFYTTRTYGLGLGLPISFDIIQRHNGSISVNSQPGEWAEFTILLPLAEN